MQLTIWSSIVCLLFVTSCQIATGQEIGSGNINIVIDNIEFIDNDVDTVILAHAMAFVTFRDSLPLEPVDISVWRFGMKELVQDTKRSKVRFMIPLPNSERDSLNAYERELLEKYLPKVDSIYKSCRYEFVGEERSTRRMAIGIPFKIKPGGRQRGQ